MTDAKNNIYRIIVELGKWSNNKKSFCGVKNCKSKECFIICINGTMFSDLFCFSCGKHLPYNIRNAHKYAKLEMVMDK